MPIEDLQQCIAHKSETLSLQYSGEDPADLVTEIAQALRAGHLRNVTSIDLGGNALAKEHVEMMADLVFPLMTHLRELDLRHNDMETEGAVLLRVAVEKHCRQLTTLDVSENRLRDLGAREIAGLMLSLPKLQSVRLGSNQLTNKCIPSLVMGLRKAKALTFLGLEFNGLGDQGVVDLLNGIRGHCLNLRRLNLSDLCLTDDAVVAAVAPFIQASTREQRVEQIDLSVNKIGAAGASALAKAFVSSTSLADIDLGCNPFGEAGHLAIAKALATASCSVTQIDLSATEMTPVAFDALLKAVVANPRILKVRTGSNDRITSSMHSSIQDLLAQRAATAAANTERQPVANASGLTGTSVVIYAVCAAASVIALVGLMRALRS